jgi:hypothetical protein
VPVAGTITGVTIFANASGSAIVLVKKVALGSYTAAGDFTSITAGTDPTLSSAIKSTTTISGWTTSVAADDLIKFTISGDTSGIATLTVCVEIQP